MPTYRIKISYQVIDTDPNPDAVVYPNSANASQSQAIDAGSADEVKQKLIDNAQARVDAAAATQARDQAILSAIAGTV